MGMTHAWWYDLEIRKVLDKPLPPVDWSIAWLWIGMLTTGLAGFGYLAYRIYRAAELFLHRVGL